LLRYRPGDYNCLHQDIYGSIAFPFQAVVFLSEPGRDYEGGEFLLVENVPRAVAQTLVSAASTLVSTSYFDFASLRKYSATFSS
jgi:hypothetical protein